VSLLTWFRKHLLGQSLAGPLPTSPNSSDSSTPKFTPARNTSESAKPPAKSYPETKVKTPNVSPRPIRPEAVVLHHSGGSYAGGVSWIKNPESRVSYHVLVAPDGRRTVFARPDQRTWHAGKSSWKGRGDLNSWSLGASFAGDSYANPLTPAAMESMAEYLVPLLKEHGISLNNVTDHRTVSPGRKDDLKPSELARFKAFLGDRLA
jgi:N-acetyl-anhydromuramyl-L-alanine amidase AmpD